jgi:predicted permease
LPPHDPAIYAAVAGIGANVAGVDLPDGLSTPLATLAGATIPVMLVLLGVQLADRMKATSPVDLAASNALRLLGAPVVMWLATSALGLDGVAQDTLIVLSATPTAVTALVIATEFSVQPRFVTLTVASSTFASIGTLTALIALNG